ncbi:MAG TPA: LptF/LptG family permease [Thermodesulfovibrio thiophilus]|nr:LptF/LptG family permease [Thermodesulfovibrio thiophilus]
MRIKLRIKLISKIIYISYINIFLVVTFILAMLFSFMVFSDQLPSVGKGDFRLIHAVIFVILTLPGRMAEFSPMSAIIATIVTLENMIRHHELIAMKAAGVTNKFIVNVFIKLSLCFVIVLFFIMEFFTPFLDQYANRIKAAAITKNKNLILEQHDFWAKEINTFINIKKIKPGHILEEIHIYEYNNERGLVSIIHAESSDIKNGKQLTLNNVTEKKFTESGIESNFYNKKTIEFTVPIFDEEFISIPIETASISGLLMHVNDLKKRGENYDYALSIFWQKFSTPFTVMAMILLCLPFFIDRVPSRGELGHEIVLAVMGGTSLYFLKYMLSYVVLLLNINPFFLIMGPVLIILGLDFFLLKKLSQ